MRRRVAREMLEMAFEASRDSHPMEFGALLRRNGDVIDELLLLPGTVSGEESALFRLHMLPIDRSVAGSLHSHPSPHPYPSEADLHFFGALGDVHIIVASPYNMRSWRAYDRRGEPLEVEVVGGRR